MEPPVNVEQQATLLKIESKEPSGPVVLINNDGTIEVTRGDVDGAGKMFWDAVRVWGKTYRERIHELELTILNLGNDPYRTTIRRGYDVYRHLPQHQKRHLTYQDVSAVLAAVEEIAQEHIQ